MKTIICDIDSTLSDHWNRIRRNTLPLWPGGVVSHKAWSREEVLQDVLLPSCHEVLCLLEGYGYYIKYLTARGWTHARRITIEQLEQWELPNPTDVLFTSNMVDKVKVLSSVDCEYYIDDFTSGQENAIPTFRKDIAEAIQNLGIKVIAFRNDWLDVLKQIQIYREKEESS